MRWMPPPRVFIAAAAVCCSFCRNDSATSIAPAAPSPAVNPQAIATIKVDAVGVAAPLVAPGGALQLSAIATSFDGTATDVTRTAVWQSSDPTIAVVTNTGRVLGSLVGAVDIVATVDGVRGTLRVNIQSGGCEASSIDPPSKTIPTLESSTYGYVQVRVPQSDCRWYAKSDAPWLRLGGSDNTYVPWVSGDGGFVYTAPTNFSLTARVGHVVLFVGTVQIVHTVTQLPASCLYMVDPPEAHFPTTGGTGVVDVTTLPDNCPWTAQPLAFGTIPLQILSGSSGTGAGRINYVVGPNKDRYAGTLIYVGGAETNPVAEHRISVATP